MVWRGVVMGVSEAARLVREVILRRSRAIRCEIFGLVVAGVARRSTHTSKVDQRFPSRMVAAPLLRRAHHATTGEGGTPNDSARNSHLWTGSDRDRPGWLGMG